MNKEIDFKQIKSYQEKTFKNHKDNAINSIINFEKYKFAKKNNFLLNKTFSLKDNFATKEESMSLGLKYLKNFKPNYNSTVFTKLLESGAIPLFKTNLDSLGLGGTGLHSNFGEVSNPFNKDKIIGGSSSGAAFLQSKEIVDFSIGSDTGGSIREPSIYASKVGFKPTWGLVSRYGLADFSPSWDTVGWITNNVSDSSLILDSLKGYDRKDPSSIQTDEKNYFKELNNFKENYKIAYIPELFDFIKEEEIKKENIDLIKKLKENKINVIEEKLDIKLIKKTLLIYKIITSLEAFSCNSNLTGFLFGDYFEQKEGFKDSIENLRSKEFNYELKKRFLFGVDIILNNYDIYAKAKKIRRLIINELNRIFSLYDALIIPANFNFTPYKKDLKEIEEFDKIGEELITVFNANGSPSITIPIKSNKDKTISLNISSKPFFDKKCLQVAKKIESILKHGK